MFKQLMIMALVIMSAESFARGGDRVGNGGDVVVCGDKVELLDIYEARLNGNEFFNPAGTNYREMLENLLATQLKYLQPKRYEYYLKSLKSFMNEAALIPGIQLNDVDDAGMVVIPTGCKLEQIAIQLSDDTRPPGKKRYTISLDLWNKLDEFNKMALVFHEIIYREVINNKANNSMLVRAMNGELLRNQLDIEKYLLVNFTFVRAMEIKDISINDYRQFDDAREVKLYQNEFNEWVIEIKNPENSFSYFSLGSNNGHDGANELVIRISDGRVLSSRSNYQNEFIELYIRANLETQIGDAYSVLSSNDVIFNYTPFGNTIAGNNFSIRYKLNKSPSNELLFKDIEKKLEFKKGSFAGKFSLDYRGLKFDKSQESTFLINLESGDVLEHKNGSGVLKIEQGEFNCNEINASDLGNDRGAFRNCKKESTKFKMLVAGKLVEVKLSEDTKGFTLKESNLITKFWDNSSEYPGNPIKVVFATKTFIGKNRLKKDVFIEAGEYELDFDAYFKIGASYKYTSLKTGKEYRDRDGVVE